MTKVVLFSGQMEVNEDERTEGKVKTDLPFVKCKNQQVSGVFQTVNSFGLNIS
jgi:hypothetical protein